jgi:hypothetical protein
MSENVLRIEISKLLLLILIIVLSVFTPGCDEDETVIPAVFVCILRQYSQEARLFSAPLADINQSVLTIEWDTVSHIFPYFSYMHAYLYFLDTLVLEEKEPYSVGLTSDVGFCEGTVTFPEATSITYPENYDTLQFGANITSTWSAAEGADYYYVWYRMSPGEDTVIFQTSTSLTLSADLFDPLEDDYYRVEIEVVPFSGAMPVPGEIGNMSGSVNGFLTAKRNFAEAYVDFWVGEPAQIRSEEPSYNLKRPTDKDFADAYFKALGF